MSVHETHIDSSRPSRFPYVLVELTDFDEESGELDVRVTAGNGITEEQIGDVLSAVQENLPNR